MASVAGTSSSSSGGEEKGPNERSYNSNCSVRTAAWCAASYSYHDDRSHPVVI